jgi:hypothetical protein
MAITKLAQGTDIPSFNDPATIHFICPICKSEKGLHFPKSVITQAKGLTTMSIARGLVCDHQFQAFVDKNFAVRGYQRVDFEFEKTEIKEKKSLKDDRILFENLVLEGNFVEYNPRKKLENKTQSKDKKRPLVDIYNEFWEFIDDDNTLFREFIKKDTRRNTQKSF